MKTQGFLDQLLKTAQQNLGGGLDGLLGGPVAARWRRASRRRSPGTVACSTLISARAH